MENKENEQLKKAWVVVVCFSLLFALFVLSGCKIIKVEGGTHKRDSVRIEQRVDTFMLRVTDSVTIQLPCSDSIGVAYIDRWRTKTVYKTREIHDTIKVCKVDSVPYPVEVTKKVKYRSGFDKFCVSFFVLFLFSTIALGAWLIFKKFYLKQ